MTSIRTASQGDYEIGRHGLGMSVKSLAGALPYLGSRRTTCEI